MERRAISIQKKESVICEQECENAYSVTDELTSCSDTQAVSVGQIRDIYITQ